MELLQCGQFSTFQALPISETATPFRIIHYGKEDYAKRKNNEKLHPDPRRLGKTKTSICANCSSALVAAGVPAHDAHIYDANDSVLLASNVVDTRDSGHSRSSTEERLDICAGIIDTFEDNGEVFESGLEMLRHDVVLQSHTTQNENALCPQQARELQMDKRASDAESHGLEQFGVSTDHLSAATYSWNEESNEKLRHFRDVVQLNWMEIQSYFPDLRPDVKRQYQSLIAEASQVQRIGRTSKKHAKRKPTSALNQQAGQTKKRMVNTDMSVQGIMSGDGCRSNQSSRGRLLRPSFKRWANERYK